MCRLPRFLPTLALLAGASLGHAVTLLSFDPGEGSYFVSGSFLGNARYTTAGGAAIGSAIQISSPSVGGGDVYRRFEGADLSPLLGSDLELRARVDAGNTMPNFTVYFESSETPYVYHYSFATRDLGQGQFAWTTGRTLDNPSFVLDSANGYSFVGAGRAFAPRLRGITAIGVEANYVFPDRANRITFDELRAVPEPASLAALSLGALALLRRRRTRTAR